MSLGNAGIVYGTRGEVFEGNRDGTLNEFIATTFNIDNVFQTKLVMGRCICHGKKALETDMLLDNEEEANKFISSRESKKPHVILIYDKHGDSTPVKESSEIKESEANVVISREQWDDLVSTLKKLEISMNEKDGKKHQETNVLHPNVICDGCYPTEQTGASEISGARFKCLNCHNFDLCSSCEGNGYENFKHKRTHNMIKVNQPTRTGMLPPPVEETMQASTKVFGTEKEVVIDIAGDRKDLFNMFSDLESLDAMVHGYKMYKKWTTDQNDEKIDEILKKANAKPAAEPNTPQQLPIEKKSSLNKASMLKVKTGRKDNVMMFQIHNEQETAVPGGLTLVCCDLKDNGDRVSFELPMGPHGILPGNHKVLKIDCSETSAPKSRNFSRTRGVNNSTACRGVITLVDEQHTMKYWALQESLYGPSFILKPVCAETFQGKLTVDFIREYSMMLFHIHNGLSYAVAGDSEIECFEDEDNQYNTSCMLAIGADGILPGHSKVIEYSFGNMFISPSKGDVVIRSDDMQYKGTTILQAGSHVVLEPMESLQVGDIESFDDVKTMQPLEKDESDGVISLSTVTTDNESSHSVSSHKSFESEDYDYLSDSDV